MPPEGPTFLTPGIPMPVFPPDGKAPKKWGYQAEVSGPKLRDVQLFL